MTAHLHYVLFGGFVFPLLAGLYYWLPLFTGRRRFFRVGELACALIFIGFHVTFLAMHWVGLLGQRRRIPSIDADSGWTLINLISSVGGFVLAIGLAMVLVDVLLHALINTRARRNPWESDGLEWAMVTPAPPYNFVSLPQVGSRHPLHATPALPLQLARGEGYLGEPREGRRETLLVQAGDGRPEALVVYPGNSRLPITLAAVTGAAFVANHDNEYYAGKKPLSEACRLISQGHGTRGACIDYLKNTVRHLRDMDIRDRGLERVLRKVET